MKTLIVKRQGSPVVHSFPVGAMAENILDVLREQNQINSMSLDMRSKAVAHLGGIIASHIQEAIQNGHKQAPPEFQQKVPDPTFSFEV